ncbi:MAG: hypothetical protein K2X27_24525 [Candidatus Obscuribacterales bacterium]|nr:hypothetical protein [Candidatus Obscuribacterales bacterium]
MFESIAVGKPDSGVEISEENFRTTFRESARLDKCSERGTISDIPITQSRLKFVNSIAFETLEQLKELDIDSNSAISRAEIVPDALSPDQTRFLSDRYDWIRNLSNDDLFPGPAEQAIAVNELGISKMDLLTLKAISGSEEELYRFAKSQAMSGMGGLAIAAGSSAAIIGAGLSAMGCFRRGFLTIGIGLGCGTLIYSISSFLNRKQLLERRYELSMDHTLNKMLDRFEQK